MKPNSNCACNRQRIKKLEFTTRLDRLAQVAVKVGLRPLPGQQIIMTAPIETLPLVRRITEHAYKSGASLVTTLFSDDEMSVARYRFGAPESFDVSTNWLFDGFAKGLLDGCARLAISAENPSLLAGQNEEFVARAAKARAIAYKPVSDVITSSHINWNICAAATPAWAKLVFPTKCEKCATSALWDAIFKASRVDAEDPIAAWDAHNKALHARRDMLNERRYSALRYSGPGTDLVIGLADDHEWQGGAGTTKSGVTFNANIPTEEVFTTPHMMRVDGIVTSTKPLSLQGNLVKDICVRFENGKIVSANASQGAALLKKLIDTDDGSCRLGEVALVPHSSPISASGLLFFNTLFDENASCHIAIGQSYAKCIKGGKYMTKDELSQRGGNYSNVHVDWMIGSNQIDIDGIKQNGEAEPLMRKGEWI